MEEHSVYTTLWNKYRPAILKLMKVSVDGPQQYKLFVHEFKAMNGKEKSFSFLMEVSEGKTKKASQQSRVATDLLYILQQSTTAQQMMSETTFQFSLDKQFVLHVARKEEVEKEVEEVVS